MGSSCHHRRSVELAAVRSIPVDLSSPRRFVIVWMIGLGWIVEKGTHHQLSMQWQDFHFVGIVPT